MAYETILAKGGRGKYSERVAGGAITPGMKLIITSSGTVTADTAEGNSGTHFAREDSLQGNTIATAYASGDQVFIYTAQPGDEIYAWLKAGENVGIGTELISAGDGTLIAAASAASATVIEQRFMALAALNLSASGAVATRLKVEVL